MLIVSQLIDFSTNLVFWSSKRLALNIGIEFFGLCLLLLSAILIGIWAYRGGHKGILLLQFFYAVAGIIGMIRWF